MKNKIASTQNQKAVITRTAHDEEYYDNSDLKRMLNLSDSTLYRMRMEGVLPFEKPRGKIYYPKYYFNQTFLQMCMKKLIKPFD